MAITDIDLSGNTFTLTPMVMTDTAQQLLESIISNITNDKQTFEQMTQQSQAKVNEIIAAVNAINDGLDIDLDELQQKVQDIINLQSELGDDSFVGLFRTLFDELNDRKEILVWTLSVTSTVQGKVGIDLSQYGFNSVDDYEVMCNIRTKGTKNLTATFEKVSSTTGTVTIRNNDHISFATNPNSFFTADATDNKVQLTLLLSKTATPIFGRVTEVDGDLDEFGEPLIQPVTLVNSSVNPTTGIYTFNGLQGTDLNTVITMIDTDPNVDFTINAVDGTDAMSIVSDSPVKVNGSITVYKSVDGTDAPSSAFNYISPYPQITVNMVDIDSNGYVTFTGNANMNGYTLNMSIDNTAYSPIVLDVNGTGSTTEHNTLAKDGNQHTIVFTVTSDTGLESIGKSKVFIVEVDPNQSEI